MNVVSSVFHTIGQSFVKFGAFLRGLPARIVAFAKTIFAARPIHQPQPLQKGRIKRLVPKPKAQKIPEKGQPVKPAVQGQASLETFKDVFQNILAPRLEINDLGRLMQVSKTLQAQTKPVLDRKIFDKITIGPKEWEKVGVIVTDVPPLPDDIHVQLLKPCSRFKGKRVFQTRRLVLMPAHISINNQGTRMHHQREGNNPTVFTQNSWDEIFTKIGDTAIDKPYWALITCNVIPDSRNKTTQEQEELIKKCPGERMPTLLEAIVLATMHFEATGEYLLGQNPVTYTRILDLDSINNLRLVAGYFGLPGLLAHFPYDDAFDYFGVLAVRKLS